MLEIWRLLDSVPKRSKYFETRVLGANHHYVRVSIACTPCREVYS